MRQGWKRAPEMAQRSEYANHLPWPAAARSFVTGLALFFLFVTTTNGDNQPEIQRLIGAGELYRALELTRQEMSLHPEDPLLLKTAGELSYRVGAYGAGSEYFRELFRISSKPAEILVLLARAQEEASLHEQASEVARQAIQLDSNVSGARVVLAQCLLAGLHHEEARDLLAPQVENGSEVSEVLLAYGEACTGTGEFDKAVAALSRLVEHPEADVSIRLRFGEALNGNKEFGRAADVLTGVLEEDPALVQGYYLLGTALMRLGRKEAAAPLLETYRSMHDLEERWYFPDMEAAGLRNQTLYEQALLHSRRGQYLRAYTGFRQAAALNPIDGAVVLASAAQLAEMEAIQEALDILRLGIERGVEPAADFFFQTGETYRLAGQTDKAQEWFNRALDIDPDHTGALLKMGQVLLEDRKAPTDAAPFLERAREKASDHWEPVFWLGRVALAQGNTTLARSRFEKSANIMGGSNAQILGSLGLNALRAGSTEEGSRFLLESMKLDRSSPETLGGLEEGLRALGDPEGAATAKEMQSKARRIRKLLFSVRSSSGAFQEKGEAFLEVAQSYQELGAPQDTVKYYRLARAASPDLTGPYRALAELASAPGECFFRANSLVHLVRLNPQDDLATRNLALFYAQLGVKLQRALQLARSSLKTNGSSEGRYVLGEILFQLGNLKEARQEVLLALQADPDNTRLQELANRITANDPEKPASNN